jgi:tRNA modification GTPase
VELLALLEGALDFAAQEVVLDEDAARARWDGARERIRGLLATAAPGRRVREGVRVVIAGPKNSGKSTLFNLLSSEDRAIVSPHPGTTRDLVETVLEMKGVPVILQDTAGIGDTDDPVELEGVRRARGATATADAVVWLWPADGGVEPKVPAVAGQAVLRLRSKWDLAATRTPEGEWIPVSCHSGEGVDTVRHALADTVVGEVADLGGNAAIAERHRSALERAATELDGIRIDEPELAAEAARNALDAVRELLGEVATEDILDRIFGRFCIGK